MSRKKSFTARPRRFHIDKRAAALAAAPLNDDDGLLTTAQAADWLHLIVATKAIWNGAIELMKEKQTVDAWLDAPPQGWRRRENIMLLGRRAIPVAEPRWFC
jgi:hypothetical protein